MEESKKPESAAKDAQQDAENKIIDLVDVVHAAPADGEEVIDLTDVVKKPDDGEIIDLIDVVPSPAAGTVPAPPEKAPAEIDFSDFGDDTDLPELESAESETDLPEIESDDIDFADVINESDTAMETVTTADMEPPPPIIAGVEASETFPPEDLAPDGSVNTLLDPDPTGMVSNAEETEPTDTQKVKEALELSDDVKVAFDDEDSEPQEDEEPPEAATDEEDFIVLDDNTGDNDLEEENGVEDELFDSMGMNIDPDSEGSETFPDIPVYALDGQPGGTERGEMISREDLETAVGAILKQRFDEKIKQIITDAVEKAVRKEIEALKKALGDELDRE